MKPTADEIRTLYAGIDKIPGLSFNAPGWNSENPNFEEAIKAVRPSVIVEAGVYLGRSCIHTLNMAKKHGLSPTLYAIDTWYGHAGQPIGHIPSWPLAPSWSAPTQMQQFLFNIKSAGFDGQVIPIQEFTFWGARILKAWGVKCQMLYLDGDHRYHGCKSDLQEYWPLLEVGGRAIGDDLHTEGGGVWRAVGEFAQEIGHDVRSESGQFVIDRIK